jgi:hypothetical protein
MIRRLIVPLTLAIVTFHAGQAFTSQALAQGAFPAPMPGRPAAAPANDPAFPPVNGAAPATSFGAGPASFPTGGAPPVGGGGFGGAPAAPSMGGGPADDCMKGFMPLRQEAEKRGKLIKAASDRHASPDEACKLIGNFGVAEVKMLKYVEAHVAQCGIPPQVLDQLRTGHKNTEGMQQKVCAVAQQAATQKGPVGPSLSEVLGSSTALPEANNTKKGSTFDTLNGNVLAR